MPTLLSIETATEVCSICLSKGTNILAAKEAPDTYQHIEAITTLIQEVIKTAKMTFDEIDAVVVSSGPGSYTALRVGVSTAKGICYAMNKPLIEVSTLKSLAGAMQKESKGGTFLPMIDARRMEVYTAIFDQDLQSQKAPYALLVSQEVVEELLGYGHPVFYGGNGALKCKEVLGERFVYKEVSCNAKNLVPLAIEKFQKKDFVDLAYFSPFYLKPPNITVAKKKL